MIRVEDLKKEKYTKVKVKIKGNNFSANLVYVNGNLISFIIIYIDENKKIHIARANVSMRIYRPFMIKINETIGRQYYTKIAKGMLSDIETKQYIVALLYYYICNKKTKRKINNLIENIRKTVNGEIERIQYHIINKTEAKYDKSYNGGDSS